MLDKLKSLETKYDELTELLSQPAIISDQSKYQKYAKAHFDLTDVVAHYREYRAALAGIEDARNMLKEETDEEFRQMLLTEIEDLQAKKENLEMKLKVLLLPKDPNDDKSVIMEIRAGTGGRKRPCLPGTYFACIPAMLKSRAGEWKSWIPTIPNWAGLRSLSSLSTELEHTASSNTNQACTGSAYSRHRIGRTDTHFRGYGSGIARGGGSWIDINDNDLKIDVYCASGPGGQCVNTTQSAVRITHLPTGVVVTCQDEKSQHKNKAQALMVLRARLKEIMEEEKSSEMAGARKSQVGSGDRSERIRTYNFPQGRVSDHRINLTLHKLDQILDGQLNEIIDALMANDQTERLKQVD
jgi:peptide chain release factor 1